MKKLCALAVMAIMLVTGFSSCKKIISAIFPGIDAKAPDVSITVPPVLFAPADELSLGNYTVRFNLDSIVRANTKEVFNANDIRSVKIKSITVSALNSDNLNNLSNFEYARMALSSNTNQAEANLVTLNFPDEATSTFTVTPESSPDIRSYLSGNELYYTIYGKMRRPTTKSLNLVVSVTLRIE